MKTGGSNYITINGSMENPVIGTFHLHRETVASDLVAMYEHGQRKLALLLWFAPLNFPAAHEHLWHHVCDSFGGALYEQHRDNIVALLALIEQTGFNELHFRFGPQGKAMDREWAEWDATQFNENWQFVQSVSALVRAAQGNLKVVFDLGVEHANERINESPVHGLYCRRMWRLYTDENGPGDSCAFSIIHGGGGATRMIRLFKIANLPLPACYCFDSYGHEYASLVSAKAALLSKNEDLKPVYMLETNYNDLISCADIRRAVNETGLDFQGIFQWPKIRDREHGDFPDVFPKRFDNYLVET